MSRILLTFLIEDQTDRLVSVFFMLFNYKLLKHLKIMKVNEKKRVETEPADRRFETFANERSE